MNETSSSGAHKHSRTEKGSLSSQIPLSSEKEIPNPNLRPMNTNDGRLIQGQVVTLKGPIHT